jgi:hypothetical protein
MSVEGEPSGLGSSEEPMMPGKPCPPTSCHGSRTLVHTLDLGPPGLVGSLPSLEHKWPGLDRG